MQCDILLSNARIVDVDHGIVGEAVDVAIAGVWIASIGLARDAAVFEIVDVGAAHD
jgi:predicted amidohydrolase